MAAPGFGYVKRDVEKTTIDWSAVSGDLTKSLGDALAAGEKQKSRCCYYRPNYGGRDSKASQRSNP